jgi:zinc protease
VRRLICIITVALLLIGAVQAKVVLPQAEEIKLDNGLTIQLVGRHTLPLFSLQLQFRAGSIYDPAGKEGLASLSSEMLMRGTPSRTARQIAEEVAFGGGSLGTFCGRESAGFRGEFLTADAETGFKVLADVLVNSLIAQEELDKTKERIIGGIQSALDDAATVAGINAYEAILGTSRFAHSTDGSISAVEKLTRADVTDFLKSHYTPDNCILVICGDIERADAERWAKQYFGSWKGTAKIGAGETSLPPVNGKEVLLLDKQDATQTQIRIGGAGIPMNHPDFYALDLARTIYAGSFTSRLVNEIRVNRGLSYGVRCSAPSFRPGGVLFVGTFTKNASVGDVVYFILSESARMQTEPVPEPELKGAINYSVGLYPLDFETNDNIAGTFASIWLYGLDKSYYEDFQERTKVLTARDVMAAAEKYFPGVNYRLVLVGKADEIKAQAEKYGTVTVRPVVQ